MTTGGIGWEATGGRLGVMGEGHLFGDELGLYSGLLLLRSVHCQVTLDDLIVEQGALLGRHDVLGVLSFASFDQLVRHLPGLRGESTKIASRGSSRLGGGEVGWLLLKVEVSVTRT